MRILITAVAAALLFPTAAGAVPITLHKEVPAIVGVEYERVGGDAFVWPEYGTKTVKQVVHRAPIDEDDDGIADSEDACIGPCPVPEPSVSAAPVASAPVASAPSVVQCESGGDYSANTGNGYYGGYQFDSSTWDAYGDSAYGEASEAPPAVQDAAAASVPYDAWPSC